MIDNNKLFKNSNEFSLHIEKLVLATNMTHMDAVLKYCEDNLLEPDEVSKMINKSLKEKIANNMRELNFLPKKSSIEL
jgi:hypothetical protein